MWVLEQKTATKKRDVGYDPNIDVSEAEFNVITAACAYRRREAGSQAVLIAAVDAYLHICDEQWGELREKYCSACQRNLPTSAFAYAVQRGKSILRSRCRECMKRYYLARNAEK